MDKIKRFEALLEKANLRYDTINYFLKSYENCFYFKCSDEEYFIDAGRLWGMHEMIRTLQLLEFEDRRELLQLILDV